MNMIFLTSTNENKTVYEPLKLRAVMHQLYTIHTQHTYILHVQTFIYIYIYNIVLIKYYTEHRYYLEGV